MFLDECGAGEWDDTLLEEGLHHQVIPLRDAIAYVDVCLTQCEIAQGVGGGEIQRDFRVCLRKPPKPRHKPEARNTGRGMHVQAVRNSLAQVLGRRGNRGKRPAYTYQVTLARGAQAHPVGIPLEESYAELRLEPCHLVADGRRGEVQLGCGHCEAATTCYRLEGEEVRG